MFTTVKGPSDFSRGQANSNTGASGSERTRKRGSQTSSKGEVAPGNNGQDLAELPKFPTKEFAQLPPTIANASLLEHIATSRFFYHYVFPNRSFCRLDLDFTTSVIACSTKRGILAEVIIALGILTLPRKTSASCLAARCRYSRALRLITQALEDPVEAKSDGVLMAVILLGLFEVSTRHIHLLSVPPYSRVKNPLRLLLRPD